MRALVFERDVPRLAAARVAGTLLPGRGAAHGALHLRDVDVPDAPGPDWVRVRPRLAGICGSDLASIDGRSSRWFEPIVSFPFVPGHEVVGELDDGTRVVVEPVLGCVARGCTPPCEACRAGDLGRCGHLADGDLAPGLQTGFCCDTGGGWSVAMTAHPSQLHVVPDELSDEAAVLVEPTACALHGALAAGTTAEDTVLVIGAGTLGLLAVAALHRHARPGRLLVVAKHPEQRTLARELGADEVIDPPSTRRGARRAARTLSIGEGAHQRLAGGVDVVVDCVGSSASIADALAVVRPGGRVVLVGMPEPARLDLTPLWQREVQLVGAYAYGTEHALPGAPRTFDAAMALVADAGLERLVTRTYPLDRYPAAIEHAATAGSRGAVKIAFDLRTEKERDRL